MKQENMTDRSAQPYRIAGTSRINLNWMEPETRGANRSCPANYVGGRMHGMSATAGWHSLHRDEVGRDLDADTAREIPHYVLFTSNSGGLWHYVHSSIIPSMPE